MSLRATAALLALVALAPHVRAQAPIDSALARYVAGIRAIDTHAHPMRPVLPGAPADSEFDALPLDGIPSFPLPWRLRAENPEWRQAQRALYGVTTADAAGALAAGVARVQRERGTAFPAWALDQIGVETMLANRVAMGPGLEAPRFRWVSFVDALMLPLDTRVEAERSPDTRALYPREATLLRRYRRDLGVRALPTTLDGYVRDVVVPTLERQKQGGAVGVKFEAAYLRPLDFAAPDAERARRIYARYAAGGGAPSRADYKVVQDLLFHEIARHAGRLGLTVQIHVTEGFGGYYGLGGSTPRQLEATFSDSTLRATTFVIVHGGWPHVGETQALLGRPNVYADLSMMDLLTEPTTLAGVLRQWLAEWPEKVLYGSDAFDGGAEQGWEQVAWLGAASARRALAIALTGMLRDGEIDRPRAEQLARMVLHDNALAAYRLVAPATR